MALPQMDENLNYGKIPLLYRHRRENLKNYINDKWESLADIPDWENIDLKDVFVSTLNEDIKDGEIVQLTEEEKRKIADYSEKHQRDLNLFSDYIVRDNEGGRFFLPQECKIFAPNNK